MFSHFLRKLWTSIAFCCLIGLLCSCGSSTTTTGGQQALTTSTTPTPTQPVSPTPLPPVQASCPAAGTARAAVLPPLPQGGHPSILYLAEHLSAGVPTHESILKKYDTVSGAKTDLIKYEPTGYFPTIMPSNEQWVAFTARIENHSAIQIVRADGQELQTLYCTVGNYDGPASWSPDLRYLAFSASTSGYSHDQMMILDTTTGQIHMLFTIDTRHIQSIHILNWASNTSFYIRYEASAGGITCNFHTLYLVGDVTRDASQQKTNLQQIPLPTDSLQPSGPGVHWGSGTQCHDFVISSDATHLLLNDYVTAPLQAAAGPQTPAQNGPSAFSLRPIAGGSATPIASDTTHNMYGATFLSNSAIWFYTHNDSLPQDQNGFWKMNTDGTGKTRVFAEQPGDKRNYVGQAFSSNGTLFALAYYDYSNGTTQTLVFGSLIGGVPTTVDTSANETMLSLVGWAML